MLQKAAEPGNKKAPAHKATGSENRMTHIRQRRQPTFWSDRVSLLHSGGIPNMAQRVRIPHRGQSPSSVTQLPILTALHARFPTLFAAYHTPKSTECKYFFHIFANSRQIKQKYP